MRAHELSARAEASRKAAAASKPAAAPKSAATVAPGPRAGGAAKSTASKGGAAKKPDANLEKFEMMRLKAEMERGVIGAGVKKLESGQEVRGGAVTVAVVRGHVYDSTCP